MCSTQSIFLFSFLVATVSASEIRLKQFGPKDIHVAKDETFVILTGYLEVLEKNSIADLDKISLIILSIDLQEIEPGAFRNLPNLKNIQLNKNRLTKIEEDTFTNLNLTELNLSQNSINKIEPGAFKNTRIENLHLSKNDISKISGIFENVTIKNLVLNRNKLKRIEPEDFAGISGLENLKLSYNKIEEVDFGESNFCDVLKLSLSLNKIKGLRPGVFDSFPNVDSINLSGNKLTDIAEGVFNHTSLISLDISFNEICAIAPNAFDGVPLLEELYINDNRLSIWDKNWIENLSNLARLDVSGNFIKEIPEGSFSNCSSLNYTNFSFNKIEKILPNTFPKFEENSTVNLRGNRISHWNGNILSGVQIHQLDIDNNKLECIEGNLTEVFSNVEILRFRDNPWSQECKSKIENFQHD